MPPSVKVLLIEDSASDAALLQEHLATVEFERFEVTHVQTLDEALGLLRTECFFDVALIDLSLPDSTGPDTFTTIQKQAPLLPLVILTGLGDEMLALEAVRRGVQDYLIKGQSDARQIVRAIRYALERSRAEEAMRESESRFRLASDASRAVVYDIDLITRRAKSVYGLSRLLGYEADLPNQNMEWWFNQVHPDDFPVTERLVRSFAHGGRHSIQYRVRHRDGHYISVEDSGSVVLNQHGEAVRVVGGIVDITLRKQAEQKLEDLRDELELMVLERTADLRRVNQTLKIITDCNEAIARANDEKELLDDICRIIVQIGGYRIAWVGFAQEDTRSVQPVSLAGVDSEPSEYPRIIWGQEDTRETPTGTAIRTGRPCFSRDFLEDPKLSPWRADALKYRFRSSIALPLRSDGRVLGNLTIYAAEPDAFDERQLSVLEELADDVAFGLTALRTRADRDRTQKELEQRSVQLRTLAAELTHTEERERRRLAQAIHDELQQLLVALKLGSDTLKKQSLSPAAAATIHHMDELIKESISVARSLTFELSPPVLYDLGLARALEWLGRWMGSKHGLTVHVTASRDAEPDNEDVRVLLFQAARELLFNIVKHAGVKTASVHMSKRGDTQVQIVVSDLGVGFKPEALSGDDTQGGFGLFSIRGRLDLVGGRMEIESEVGQGSRVTLLAPLVSAVKGTPRPAADAAAGTHKAGPPEPPSEGRRTKIRVLLADDHMLIREGLRRLLHEQEDVEMVGEAGDGQAALELALKLKPDVVLMDINMPKLNGIAATRRVMEMLPQTKVIGLSVSDEPDLLEAMQDAGAVGFVSKGSAVETLIATIRSSLSAAKSSSASQ